MRPIQSTVAEQGFVYLPRLEPKSTGIELAGRLGKPWVNGRHPVHRIVPAAIESSTPNTYSGLYGYGRFPYHTDLAHYREPPRYFMLRCTQGFPHVSTCLIDGLHMVRALGEDLLARALVQPRRNRNGGRPLLHVYQPHDGERGLLRWDEVFVQPASRTGESVWAAIVEYLESAKPFSFQLCEPGDTLIVDNWRMLHARSAVPAHCINRVIERAYFRDIK